MSAAAAEQIDAAVEAEPPADATQVPYYESDKGLSEYLLFHYGTAAQTLPESLREVAPRGALDYPARCVHELLAGVVLPAASLSESRSRALDLGCAVGRSTFELTAYCHEAIGIDYSHRFVDAAWEMQRAGRMSGSILVEGDTAEPAVFELGASSATSPSLVTTPVDRSRASFRQGDAMALSVAELGAFDILLMANLIDRLHEPRRCLAQLPALVRPGGILLITSPYTWLPEYTPRSNWLSPALPSLKDALHQDFTLLKAVDLPFLIREHVRKFQWSVAQGTVWRRNGA